MLRSLALAVSSWAVSEAHSLRFPTDILKNATGGKVVPILKGWDQGCWKGPYPYSQSDEFSVSSNMTSPAIGDWFGITFDFTLNPAVTVSGGVVHYTSILNGFIPYDTDDDLCIDAKNGGGKDCPLTGVMSVTGSVQIPDVSSIKLTEEWVDQDGNQICCATMTFSF